MRSNNYSTDMLCLLNRFIIAGNYIGKTLPSLIEYNLIRSNYFFNINFEKKNNFNKIQHIFVEVYNS